MITNPYPLSQAEFDAAMLEATQIGDLIYLPDEVIDWQLEINNICTIMADENTSLDVSTYILIDETPIDAGGPGDIVTNRTYNYDILEPVVVTAAANIIGLSVINRKEAGYLGYKINDTTPILTDTISSASIAYTLTNVVGGEFENINGHTATTALRMQDCRNNNFVDSSFADNDVGIELIGSSTAIGDAEEVVGVITLEADRTNRTHHNTFTGVSIFQNKIGINFINANHNTFDSSTVKTSTNIGIFHTPNSYSNSFRGEIFENQNYGVRNLDKEGGVHVFDAMDTWWGDITGPSSFGPGQGDKISSEVLYEPWRKSGTEPELMHPVTRDWIWQMLGDPLVRVELTEQQVSSAIDMAVKRWMYYRTSEPNYYYLYVDASTQNVLLPADLPKESIMEVVYQPYSNLYSQLSGSGESFFLTYYMQKSGGTFLADFYISIQYKEMFERTLGMNPSYEFLSYQDPISGEVQDMIKIYPRPSMGMKLAVKYSRVLTETEVDANDWIRKYALTWAKEMLGRVRSKFSSVPGPTGEISLDGPQLLSEAVQEREALDLDIVKKSEPLGFTTG